MNGCVHQVMRARVHTEQLAIQHVRQRGDGMPVTNDRLGKRVNEAVRRQTSFDLVVLGDELRIVVINEVVLPYRPIDAKRDGEKQETDYKRTAHAEIQLEARRKDNEKDLALDFIAVSAIAGTPLQQGSEL